MVEPLKRVSDFCSRFQVRLPIVEAPMAGSCPAQLAAAVANAGGMGAMGALLNSPDEIRSWAAEFRRLSSGAFQLNIWVPGPPPARDHDLEARQRAFLARFGPEVAAEDADSPVQDFTAQCEAMLAARPTVISSIMGLFDPRYVGSLKSLGIGWFACATTVEEAVAAEAAGADAIVVQGIEAGGHRGTFEASKAEQAAAGLMALIPHIADRVSVPVIAAGGIGDGRGVAAALMLGASAVQIGTALLRCPEAGTHQAWAAALADLPPDGTAVTRAFTGRPARSIANAYVQASRSRTAPEPAPYPIQRSLTKKMKHSASAAGDIERMQAWAGQGAALARPTPAGQLVERLWQEATRLLASSS